MNKLPVFIIFYFCVNTTFNAQQRVHDVIDSIEIYKAYSKDKTSYSNKQRLYFAEKAKKLSLNLGIDSIIVHTNRRLSTVYWETQDFEAYKNINIHNGLLSAKIGDSSSLARANYKLGIYYKYHKYKSDSAYYYFYNAEKIYRLVNNKYNLAETLNEISIIQKNGKDFIGSEVNSITAIEVLEQIEQTNEVRKLKSYLYNNLGLNFDQLERYDISIDYYNKALSIKRKLVGDNKESIDNSINNLALAYKNLGEYNLSKNYYMQILSNTNLINERPDFYAKILNNYAHTLYVSGDLKNIPNLYFKALKVSDSINPNGSSNTVTINQYLAEYYNDKKIKDSAKYYAYRAKDIAIKYHNDDLLTSLLLLTKVEVDSLALKYSNDYIKLNDSLLKMERVKRDKFARIRFETNQYIDETKRLSKQNLLIGIISLISILVIALIYFIRRQLTKNQILQLESQQQKANEDIYKLILNQQTKFEEGRQQERHRISEELHDDILNNLLGIRLSLQFLVQDKNNKEFTKHLNHMQSIEKDIRDLSHELKASKLNTKGDFIAILNDYVEKQSNLFKFKYHFSYDVNINWDTINNNIKVNIYRIIQESVLNIGKHAKANHIKITITLNNKSLNIIIADNGVGFKNKNKGIGLLNMKSRVSKLNGTLKINSNQNTGTTINVNIDI